MISFSKIYINDIFEDWAENTHFIKSNKRSTLYTSHKIGFWFVVVTYNNVMHNPI